MPETKSHLDLVEIVASYINGIVDADFRDLIQVDSPYSSAKPPVNIDGHRPDVRYCFNGLLIVGEAKTCQDLESKRSKSQYTSFLKECSFFSGKSLFVLGVSLVDVERAQSVVQRIRRSDGVFAPCVILNELGMAVSI